MNLLVFIFNALLNLLSVYIDFRMIDFFLEKKDKNSFFTKASYLMVWLLNYGIVVLFENVYLTSVSLVLFLLIATVIIYQGGFIRKIVAVFSTVALGIVVDDILWRLCSYFNVLDQIELFANLIVSLILMVLLLLFEYLFRFDKKTYITRESYLNIALVLCGNVLIIYILTDIAEVKSMKVMLALIVVCFVDISVFWLHNKVNEVYREKVEQQVMEEQIVMYKKQFQIIQQSQKKISSLRHDIKNHLYLVKSYLDKEDYEAAQMYIQKLGDYITVSGQYVETGNQELDSILNYSLEKAKRMQVKIETRIHVPQTTFMQAFDLNILFGNLLDNALEALEKVQERYLYIGISFKNGILLIHMRNSFDGIINQKNNILKTRKENSKKHGIGMQNIKDVIRKYEGDINIQTTENLFTVDIILYLQQKDSI